jgi:putative ABC transport system ATP-binding protein
MIKVRGLCKQIFDGNSHKVILNQLDFNLGAGQSAAISGESGSGKSTFLNILGSLDKADKGQVCIADLAIHAMTASQADHYRKKRLGIVFQQFNLIDCLSVWDNIVFPAKLNHIPISQYHHDLVKALGLTEHINKLPANLSGGEQQRVAIARAMSHQPSVVLADEPTGNLDYKTSQIVSELLFGLCKKLGITLVVVTHSQAVASHADWQFVMNEGRLLQVDTAPAQDLDTPN